jgi:hypothetical protein
LPTVKSRASLVAFSTRTTFTPLLSTRSSKAAQAGAIVQVLGAADPGIPELVDHRKAMTLRVLGYGRGLPVPGIPINLPQAGAAEVADRLGEDLGFHFSGDVQSAEEPLKTGTKRTSPSLIPENW